MIEADLRHSCDRKLKVHDACAALYVLERREGGGIQGYWLLFSIQKHRKSVDNLRNVGALFKKRQSSIMVGIKFLDNAFGYIHTRHKVKMQSNMISGEVNCCGLKVFIQPMS